MKLLDWATPGTHLLVGVSDPLDPDFEPTIVEGVLGAGWDNAPAVMFSLPGYDAVEQADATRLGDTWNSVHQRANGDGVAITVFTPESAGHIRWQQQVTQRRIRRLIAERLVTDPKASAELASLSSQLHKLTCQAALLAQPAGRAAAA